MKAVAKKSTENQRNEHNAEKHIHWVTHNAVTLAFVASQICEIPWNAPKIRTYRQLQVMQLQGHRSCCQSKAYLVNIVNRKLICDFLLVINSNFGRTYTFFEILTFTDRKLVFPPLPYLTLS